MEKILPGSPYPLGAIWDGPKGVNFSIYSESATRIELCLFDPGDTGKQIQSITLNKDSNCTWHVCLAGVKPGLLYGYRVVGPYEPEKGFRFNPAKLLIDPYARAVVGRVNWKAPIFGYQPGHPDADLSLNKQDSSWSVPKCLVINSFFPWNKEIALHTPCVDRPR